MLTGLRTHNGLVSTLSLFAVPGYACLSYRAFFKSRPLFWLLRLQKGRLSRLKSCFTQAQTGTAPFRGSRGLVRRVLARTDKRARQTYRPLSRRHIPLFNRSDL